MVGFILLFVLLIGLVVWILAIPLLFVAMCTEAAVRRKYAKVIDNYKPQLHPFYEVKENFTKGGCCTPTSYTILLKATFDSLPTQPGAGPQIPVINPQNFINNDGFGNQGGNMFPPNNFYEVKTLNPSPTKP